MFEKPEIVFKNCTKAAIGTNKGQGIKYLSCSPDTEGRCFCRSHRPHYSSDRGMTLSSIQGSRGMWSDRDCWAPERPGSGDRGWRQTAPLPSWWGGSGLLASSRTLDCVLTQLVRVMFWSRIWCRLTRVAWSLPGLGQHQPPTRPRQCASTGVVWCVTV